MKFDRRPITTTGITTLQEIVVVIPAHNEQDRLPGCLASVRAAAERVEVPVEVIVVLDACTDGTARAVAGSVRTITVRAENVGRARAAGFAAFTRADPAVWFATTDADCLVPAHWLTNQLAHQRRSAQAVVGTVSVDWREHSLATQRRYERLYATRGSIHGHVHGANLGVRADAYWRVGGFRGLRVGEDVDLVERLMAARTPVTWEARHPVSTSDRRDARARGGFGDFVNELAEVRDDDASGGYADGDATVA